MKQKKGKKDASKIWRHWFNCRVSVSKSPIEWPFHFVAEIVCKMCLVWTAEQRVACSLKRPPELLNRSNRCRDDQIQLSVCFHSPTSPFISTLSRWVAWDHWMPILQHTTYASLSQPVSWEFQSIQQLWGKRNVCNHPPEGKLDGANNCYTAFGISKSACIARLTFHATFSIKSGKKNSYW